MKYESNLAFEFHCKQSHKELEEYLLTELYHSLTMFKRFQSMKDKVKTQIMLIYVWFSKMR